MSDNKHFKRNEWQRCDLAVAVRSFRGTEDTDSKAISIGRNYVVSAVLFENGELYLVVLGDDMRGYKMLSSFFKPL